MFTPRQELMSAKYQLDRTLFGMQEFVKDIQDAVSFDYELRSLGRSQAPNDCSSASSVPIPLSDSMERARLQSDIDLNTAGGRAFVGVRRHRQPGIDMKREDMAIQVVLRRVRGQQMSPAIPRMSRHSALGSGMAVGENVIASSRIRAWP